ncbi:chitin deacetylase [Actinomortierella ambigua]|uniref:Chitin deacetylase n=1 Tax=Actinomortierella ambigua TaxID=1343610 RepID=A0A9P6QHZ8_9FUNG|nr:chitin deacetylase [Actinomortierella ambigua]
MLQNLVLSLGILAVAPMISFAALNASEFPVAGAIPPVTSPQVKQWLAELDLTGAPTIQRNSGDPPECPSTNDPKVCYWTCDDCAADDVLDCPNKNDWGLTFDDGPTVATPGLLDFLTQHSVKATFFLIGSNVVKYPEMVVREVTDGHHLASHTWSHHALTTLTNEQIVAELRWTEKAIFDATGLRVKYMRPPYGDVDNRVRFVLRKMGYIVVDWTGDTFDSNDWKIPAMSPSSIAQKFESAITGYSSLSANNTRGFISLEHDLNDETVSVAKLVIPKGLEAKLNIKTVASCLGDANGYAGGNTTANATSTTTAPNGRPTGSTDGPVHPASSASRNNVVSTLTWSLFASTRETQQSIHHMSRLLSLTLVTDKLVWSGLISGAFALGLAIL